MASEMVTGIGLRVYREGEEWGAPGHVKLAVEGDREADGTKGELWWAGDASGPIDILLRGRCVVEVYSVMAARVGQPTFWCTMVPEVESAELVESEHEGTVQVRMVVGVDVEHGVNRVYRQVARLPREVRE